MRSIAIPTAETDVPADPQGREQTSLLELVADWYWEQDSEFRFTVISGRHAEKGQGDPFPFVGRKLWEAQALNLSDADWRLLRSFLVQNDPADSGQLGQQLKNNLMDRLCALVPPPACRPQRTGSRRS